MLIICSGLKKKKKENQNNGEENKASNISAPKRNRLSLKRTADRLSNEIKKRLKIKREREILLFTVSDPDENYFVLDIHDSKSFHKTEAAQEITYRAKLKHPAPDKNLSKPTTSLVCFISKFN